MMGEEYGPLEAIWNYEPGKIAARQAKMIEEHAHEFPDGYWFEWVSAEKALVMRPIAKECEQCPR